MYVPDLVVESIRSDRELIDVTCLSRPDTAWHYVDQQGHEHFWTTHHGKRSSRDYNPRLQYKTPTLVKVHDGYEHFDDGAVIELSHLECWLCGERVEPGYCADEYTQYVEGLRQHGELTGYLPIASFEPSMLDDELLVPFVKPSDVAPDGLHELSHVVVHVREATCGMPMDGEGLWTVVCRVERFVAADEAETLLRALR